MKVKLSKEEVILLQVVAKLHGISNLDIVPMENIFILNVDLENTNKLRDYVSDRLLESGFDIDYNPTSEGKILERLIDKLFTE
ncbi:MAG: hypothetical protein HYV97_00445 [Bdellovibrio sp.]|nr:hypothetical protein [Bdellovibrio sp.]